MQMNKTYTLPCNINNLESQTFAMTQDMVIKHEDEDNKIKIRNGIAIAFGIIVGVSLIIFGVI